MAMGNDYTDKVSAGHDALEALLAKATPGPFEVGGGDSETTLYARTGRRGTIILARTNAGRRVDLHALAALRNAAPAMLAELREQRAELTRLRAVAEAARVLHAKLERETVDDPVAWADQMVGDALAALEGT